MRNISHKISKKREIQTHIYQTNSDNPFFFFFFGEGNEKRDRHLKPVTGSVYTRIEEKEEEKKGKDKGQPTEGQYKEY